MAEKLALLRKEKFGKEEYDDFNGPSDSSEAPEGFQFTLGQKSFQITPETVADSDTLRVSYTRYFISTK